MNIDTPTVSPAQESSSKSEIDDIIGTAAVNGCIACLLGARPEYTVISDLANVAKDKIKTTSCFVQDDLPDDDPACKKGWEFTTSYRGTSTILTINYEIPCGLTQFNIDQRCHIYCDHPTLGFNGTFTTSAPVSLARPLGCE